MDTLYATIEEIRTTLDRLRQDPQTRRRFPKELWDSIVQLTRSYSFNTICSQLDISPAYLKQKVRKVREEEVEFHELSFPNP